MNDKEILADYKVVRKLINDLTSNVSFLTINNQDYFTELMKDNISTDELRKKIEIILDRISYIQDLCSVCINKLI